MRRRGCTSLLANAVKETVASRLAWLGKRSFDEKRTTSFRYTYTESTSWLFGRHYVIRKVPAIYSGASPALSPVTSLVHSAPKLAIAASQDPLCDTKQLYKDQKRAFKALIRYLYGLMPVQVPLASNLLATVEIFKALAPLPTELYAIEAGFVLDIHPQLILDISRASLTITRATLDACPSLATFEVTTVTAALARCLRRANKVYIASTSAPPMLCASDEDVGASPAPSLVLEEEEAALLVESNTTSVESQAFQTPVGAPRTTLGDSTPAFSAAWNEAMDAQKRAKIANMLEFPCFSMVNYKECSDKLQNIQAFAAKDPLYASSADLAKVASTRKRVECIMAAAVASGETTASLAGRLQEPGAKELVETVHSVREMCETDKTLEDVSLVAVEESIKRLVDRVVLMPDEVYFSLKLNKSNGNRKKTSKLPVDKNSLQILTAGSIAVGCIYTVLERQPELVDCELSHLFIQLFDGVVTALGLMEGCNRVKLGSSLCALNLHASNAAEESLAFVEEVASSQQFVSSLLGYIISDKEGYRRSSGIPTTAAQNIPPSKNSKSPASDASAPTKARSGRSNNNNNGSSSNRSNRRGRGRNHT